MKPPSAAPPLVPALDADAASAPAARPDFAASYAALQHVALHLAEGRAHEALTLSRDLFASGRIAPSHGADLCNLAGAAAHELGAEPVAEQMWRAAVAADAGHVAALMNLGGWLARQDRNGEAATCFERVLGVAPRYALARTHLGVLRAAAGANDEAERCHRQALADDPQCAAAWLNLGVMLAAQDDHEAAVAHYASALRLTPQDAAALSNLALSLAELERPAEAEHHHRRAVELAPSNATIRSNFGNFLAAQHREVEAETELRRAVELDPASASAVCNLGAMLRDADRDAEAEACFRHGLALRPSYALGRLHLSALLLAQGHYAEGWPMHEARFDPALLGNGIPPPALAIAPWRGEPLQGRSMLVWPEQGLGDQIQFSRYATLLKAQGAARVTVVCQRPLQVLFASLPNVDAVHGADVVDNRFVVREADLSNHDHWCFPLSLPQWSKTEVATIPAPIPYLRASPERIADFAERIDTEAAGRPRHEAARLRIGLVWRGNPRHDNDAERSLPGLQTLAPLWSLPDLDFVSLQAGAAGLVASAAPSTPAQPVRHWGIGLRDFADTAAALMHVDLLISVDTSIAHLAGALGRPCWLLLPARKTDWRWLQGREDSPWYPGTMRLFRQPRRGDWGSVVDALCERLRRDPPARSRLATPLEAATRHG